MKSVLCAVFIIAAVFAASLGLTGCNLDQEKTLTLAGADVEKEKAHVFASGDVEKGKALFNDAKLAGGTTGKSCNSCHPGGRGLEDVGEKTEWKQMGKTFKRLEDVVNYDIETALHGKPLDPKSEEMVNIISYIISLK